MKRILIIGSEGFIGNNAVNYFLQDGWDVSGVDIKHPAAANYRYFQILPQSREYKTLFEKTNPDVCLFASGSASVGISIEDPVSDLEANFLQVTRILNSIKTTAPHCRFINISSAAVYGNPASLPVSEDSEIKPLSPYGWHKYYSELACKEYSALYNLKTCSLRPFSIYGPGQKKLLLWDIFNKSKSADVVLFGTGEETRDFIFIDDFLRALSLIIDHSPLNGEAINAATGTETTIASISKLFLEKLGSEKSRITFNQQIRPGDPLHWKADVQLLNSYGFKPGVSLDEGLQIYAEWLARHS